MGILQDRIRSTRLMRSITLKELAIKLNVKEATMQRYESGEIKNIKHETIGAIADALDVSPSYLMGWTDDPSPKSDSAELANALADLSDGDLKRVSDFMEVAADLTDDQFDKVMAFAKFLMAGE